MVLSFGFGKPNILARGHFLRCIFDGAQLDKCMIKKVLLGGLGSSFCSAPVSGND